MTNVPVPRQVCAQISAKAVQYAREDIRSRGWSDKAVQALVSYPSEGQVGLKTTVKYLMFQDRGIKPFVMHWVAGRTVPIKGTDGTHFVYAKPGVPGTPGWVTLPGGVRKWREQRWRHPGLKPKSFMENALSRALKESRPMLQQQVMAALKAGSGAGRRAG